MKRTLAALKRLAVCLATLGLLTNQAIAFVSPLRTNTRARVEGTPNGARRAQAPSRPRAPAGLRIIPYALVRPFLWTVAGGLKKDQGALVRMRTLAQRARNGALTTCQRTALNEAYGANENLIAKVARATSFGDLGLLTGKDDVLLEGPPPGLLVFLDLPDATLEGLNLSGATANLTTVTNAAGVVTLLDSALTTVAEYRTDLRSAWIQLQY